MRGQRLLAVLEAAALALASGPVAGGVQPSPLDPLLLRARAHALVLAEGAGVLVAEERVEQHAVMFAVPSRDRAAAARGPARLSRTIVGDTIFMRVPVAPGWLVLRDTYEVDEEAVGERTDRVLHLVLEAPEAAVLEAPLLYDEAARHALGPLPRVLSSPTLGLVALHPGYEHRFQVRPRGVEQVGERRARVFEFEETERPTLIPGPQDRPLPLRIRVSVDEAEGVVLKTVVSASTSVLAGSATVFFEREARLRAWLPARLQDRYSQVGSPWNYRAEATYTNYRCFREGALEPSLAGC